MRQVIGIDNIFEAFNFVYVVNIVIMYTITYRGLDAINF